MKKNTLLKAMTIAFLVFVVLTWIIPTGSFSSGTYVEDAIVPVGLFDLIRYPLVTITSSVFILIGTVVVLIGILYSLLNKIGVYQSFVDKIVKKYKGNEKLFLIITTCIFLVLSSLTGLDLVLFVLVPFFATVILLLGINKFTAMLSTIGAILVGNFASTYGFNIAGYVSYFTNDINNSIWFRVGLFVLSLVILLFTVIKSSKVKGKTNEIMFYEKIEDRKTTKSVIPMIVILSLTLLISIVGMIKWSELFKITLFTDIFNNIKNFEIAGYKLFGNLIGSMYNYGSWTNYELAMMLVIAIITISIVYKVKKEDFIDAVKLGSKKMAPVVFYLLLANTIFLIMNVNSDTTIFATIVDKLFGLVEGFNGFIFGIITFIGSFLYNDFPYLLGAIYDPITSLYSDSIPTMGMIAQGIHGLIQLIAPTSLLLVIGLTYFDISYTEWFKKIIKFVLLAFLALIVVVILMILI